MKYFNNILFAMICILFIGCSYVQKDFDPYTGLKDVHKVNVRLWAPSTVYSFYYFCDKIDDPDLRPSWEHVPKNCVKIDQKFAATNGIFPSIAGPALYVAGTAIIADAIRDSADTVSNQNTTNNQNSIQTCRGNCSPPRGGGSPPR